MCSTFDSANDLVPYTALWGWAQSEIYFAEVAEVGAAFDDKHFSSVRLSPKGRLVDIKVVPSCDTASSVVDVIMTTQNKVNTMLRYDGIGILKRRRQCKKFFGKLNILYQAQKRRHTKSGRKVWR